MMKKKLYARTLLILTIISACLLVAAGPVTASTDLNEPVIKTEEEIPETETEPESEPETEPGIAPLNDNESNKTTIE